MSEGKLRCSGSPLFLKSRFGAGYILTVSKGHQGKSRTNLDEDLLRMLQRVVPQAKLASSIAGEVIFNLPITSAPSFGQLFQLIKVHKDDYGLSSYGICITTLEQVFIQLAHENKASHQNEDEEDEEGNGLSPFVAAAFGSFGIHQKHVSKRIVSPLEGDEEVGERPVVEMVRIDAVADKGEVIDAIPNQDTPPPPSQYLPLSLHEDLGAIANLTDVEKEGDGIGSSLQMNLGGWTENQYLDKVSTQLLELLRKRWVIALRDPNGLFFQLVLPAMQIALVLSILMINVNPAGRTLTLNAAMFPVHPTALYSEGSQITPQQSLYHSNFNDIRMDLLNTNSTTSLQSSEHMLETYSDPGGDRFGAYVFGDQITANLTVNWLWIGENLELLLNNSDSIISLLEETGVVSDLNLNDLISIDQRLDSQIILDFLDISDGQQLNLTEAIRTFADLLFGDESSLNATITLFNQTFTESELIDALDSLLLPRNSSSLIRINTTQLEASVAIHSIQIVNGEVKLIGVTLEINNRTLELGNVTLTSNQLQSLLPNTTETYSFQIPSSYSILHNTSSPHAIGAFLGELTAAMFQVKISTSPLFPHATLSPVLPLTRLSLDTRARIILSPLLLKNH